MTINRCLALLGLVALVLSLHQANCSAPVPDKLYTSTKLFLAKDRVTNDLKHYQVEEYVNLDLKKSSTLVRQHWRDEKTQIYYNEVSQSDQVGQRKFLVFDVDSNTCADAITIGYWDLAILRRVAIILYTSQVPVQQRYVDIAIGPSVLLYAIQSTLDEFKFRETKLASGPRLTSVDVFERRIQIEGLEDYSELDLLVSIRSRVNTVTKDDTRRANETLIDEVQLDQDQLEIVSVVACKVPEAGSDNDVGGSPEKPTGNSDTPNSDGHVAATLACGHAERVLFHIDYNLVEEYTLASLTGRRIYEQTHYDFHREPFAQPVGIGCWGSQLDWQRSFWRPRQQFSAEYSTNNGTRGLSYVAYDGYANVLRLDRLGRKSVYDLASRMSYHIGQFSSAHEANQAEEDVSKERCLALKISEPALEPTRAMNRLMGLSSSSVTRHLGSKLIDHVHYELYEIDADYLPGLGFNLPILLQPLRYAPETNFYASKHFYITFYVHEYPNMIREASARSQDGLQEKQAVYSVPKFIELWQFSTTTRKRSLVNRLVFSQFSWSLEVLPSNDPDAQLHLANLFNIPHCHQTRATQGELDFYILPFSGSKLGSTFSEQQLVGLRASLPEIEEILQERLATILGISRLNIDQLEASLLPGGELAVRSRIVELVQGIEYSVLQGAINFSDKFFEERSAQILKIYSGRHSLDDCKLDSASWSKANYLVYCPKRTTCVLMEQDPAAFSELKGGRAPSAGGQEDPASKAAGADDDGDDQCRVYSFSYMDIYDQHELKTLKLAEENEHKIAGTRFSFDYKWAASGGASGGERRLESATFAGFGLVTHLRLLDPVGARWGVGAQSLVGLAYTTSRDQPLAFNLNRRIELTRADTDAFKHCQLACQMDDYCGSFSICLRNTNANKRSSTQKARPATSDSEAAAGCVLSAVRLTATLLGQLSSLARASKRRGQSSDTFELKVTGESLSQVLVMRNDDQCSLHAKDFLSEYVSMFEYLPKAYVQPKSATRKTIGAGGLPPFPVTGLASTATPPLSPESNSGAVELKSVSLAECAGASFGRCLDATIRPPADRFTYCPLESYCLLTDELGELDKRTAGGKFCRVYERTYRRFYNEKPLSHMKISYENVAGNSTSSHSGEMALADPKPVAANGDSELHKLGWARTFWGLNSEECARECNLYRSKCLAFDSCKQGAKRLCILYSMRSPKSSPYLPKLARESGASGNSAATIRLKSVRLGRSELCDHYWLKPSFFAIRLQQFLSYESGAIEDRNASSATPSKAAELIESVEAKIESLDEAKSKAEFERLEGAGQATGGLQDDPSTASSTRSGGGSGGLHLAMLLVGLTIGCVFTLFRIQIVGAAASLYQMYLIRRGTGGTTESLSQLVLNDQLR